MEARGLYPIFSVKAKSQTALLASVGGTLLRYVHMCTQRSNETLFP
jgi:hypothetical protein